MAAVQYVGTGVVASWLGRGAASVSDYRSRFENTPEPDAYLNGAPGWLPERKADWQNWFRTYGPGSARRPDAGNTRPARTDAPGGVAQPSKQLSKET